MSDHEDFLAEMRRDIPEMTEAEWQDFIEEQQAAADVAAERKAERALSIGYASS
jgi:hypothetical protein